MDRKAVDSPWKTAPQLGHLRQGTYFLAILAGLDGQSVAHVAVVLRVHEQTVAPWIGPLGGYGPHGAPHKKPPGRPPQLPPTPKDALAPRIAAGPVTAGVRGACGRSPMSPQRLAEPFGVSDNVFYRAQWLKPLGLSWQKAACVSAPREALKRHAWRTKPGPQMLRAAPAQPARLLGGDAASVPPWGPLTDTWARRGQHPRVQTSGTRTGDKVVGLIDACTGHCFYPGQAGRLNAAASLAFLRRGLAHTTHPVRRMQAGAKDHPSADTNTFLAQQAARLQVCQLPTDAPDDNPLEQLGQKRQQQDTPRHYFPTWEALTEQVEQALRKFAKAPEEVLALCRLPTALAQAAYARCLKNLFLECYRTRGAGLQPVASNGR